MKGHTDLPQSKKLAEFLPIESADMWYDNNGESIASRPEIRCGSFVGLASINIPCWSLAVLLDILPNEISTGEEWHNKYQIDIRKYDGVDNTTWYQIAYGNNRGSSGSWHDMINTGERQNLIDCCVDMILLCKEHNWL